MRNRKQIMDEHGMDITDNYPEGMYMGANEFATVQEIERLTGLTPRFMHRMLDDADGPPYLRVGTTRRAVRYRWSKFINWYFKGRADERVERLIEQAEDEAFIDFEWLTGQDLWRITKLRAPFWELARSKGCPFSINDEGLHVYRWPDVDAWLETQEASGRKRRK